MTFDPSNRTSTRTETVTSFAQGSVSTRARARLSVFGARSVRRARRWMRHAVRWLGETVTAAGWVAVAVAVLATLLGLSLGIVEWLVAGLAALVLLLIGSVFLFGANAYQIDLGVLEDHVVAGDEVTGDITVTNVSRRPALPGRLEIPIGAALAETHVPLLLARATHAQRIGIPAQRRGVIAVGPVRSVRADPIGLLHRDIQWTKRHTLFVHPKTVSLPTTASGFVRDLEGTPSSALVSDDISFHAVREYMPGDAPRNIHWKSTAKTGTLMVRQYEETRRSKVGVVLGMAADDFAADDEFELAVSAAASIGVRLIRDRRDLDVVVSAEVPESARRVIRSARRLSTFTPITLLNDFSGIDRSAQMMRLDEVATLTAQQIDGLSLVFMVCGSSLSLHDLQTAAHRFGLDTAVVVVRVDLDTEPGVQRIGDITVFTLGVLDDLRHLMARVVQS